MALILALSRRALLGFFALATLMLSVPAQAQVPANTARIHLNRFAADYAGWFIYTWTGAQNPSASYPGTQSPSGTDAYGVYYDVQLQTGAPLLNFILTTGSAKNCDADMALSVATQGYEIWQRQNDCTIYTSAPAVPPPNTARIHYNRVAADYAGWVIYTWTGALNPSSSYPGSQGPAGTDTFGAFYDVPLQPGASLLNYILTNGGAKNCGADMALAVATVGGEIWQLQDDCTIYASRPSLRVGDVGRARAHWLTPTTIAWPGAAAGDTYRLFYSPAGGISTTQTDVVGGTSIPLSAAAGGLDTALQARYPHLASSTALNVAAADLAKVPAILRGQIVVARYSGTRLADATSLQIPGVLDALYRWHGALGATLPPDREDADPAGTRRVDGLLFRVWAPTAQAVRLQVFDSATAAVASQIVPMSLDAASGVWSAAGNRGWVNRRYYAYEVTVFSRATGRVEVNLVTDPYSLGLSTNSQRSLVVDLNSDETRPRGWRDGDHGSDDKAAPLSVYELHVRDFSIGDDSVPAADRGKFAAFAQRNSRGMQHLRDLARAGLSHVHLLPAFDFATVPENPADQRAPAVPNAAPDSDQQQAAVGAVRDRDGFNWGYDPWHYTVPEGSYASNADGLARIREFRSMVQGLHDAGLKVAMDVVYNHTTAAGQDPRSVLDRIVPGYYHRLDAAGTVLSDTCCSDTAAEHAMFEKLMIDSTEVWARQYNVDAFRFDLMAFHPRDVMLRLRANLRRYVPDVYVYGEGWNFGAVANNARFVQASQLGMAGTGVGTFSDRLRDAVRGGGPFDSGTSLVRNQGFINGLWYDNNALADPQNNGQRDWLAHLKDLSMLGLAGNLADYTLVDQTGAAKRGAQIDYFGQPAGYALTPRDNVVYISAHDNQTLFDINQYKLPQGTVMADRVRANVLGSAIVALAQGVSFFHAGDDLLRSKSFDNNSYDSGDWFNRLDFSFQSNNFGVGLPPAWANGTGNWSVMAPLLRDANLRPGANEIDDARRRFQDFLRIRASSSLFNLASSAEIQRQVRFYNTGTSQNPALIVMAIAAASSGNVRAPGTLVVLFNADRQAVTYAPRTGSTADFAGTRARLHRVQRDGADPTARTASFDNATGSFTVPARTAAVFVVGGD